MSQRDLDELDEYIRIAKVLGINSKEGLINYVEKHIPDKKIIDPRRLYFFKNMYKHLGIHTHGWVDKDIARTKKVVLRL